MKEDRSFDFIAYDKTSVALMFFGALGVMADSEALYIPTLMLWFFNQAIPGSVSKEVSSFAQAASRVMDTVSHKLPSEQDPPLTPQQFLLSHPTIIR